MDYNVTFHRNSGTSCEHRFVFADIDEAIERLSWVKADSNYLGYTICDPRTGRILAEYDKLSDTIERVIVHRSACLPEDASEDASEDEDADETVSCASCGDELDPDDAYEADDDLYCPDCYNEQFHECSMCCDMTSRDEMTFVECDDEYVCDYCFRRNYSQCEHCGEYERDDELVNVATQLCSCGNNHANSEQWCRNCVDRDVMDCEECGRSWYAYELDDDNICPMCLNSGHGAAQRTSDISRYRAPRGVQDWNYRPTVCFCPETDAETIFYGYELEIESHDNDRHEWAEEINETLGYTYAKHDGSLNDGFEIVSHPATLEYHLSKADTYRELFKRLRDEGFRSHDDGTCGLHVHISLRPLEAKNAFAVHNLLILFDRFWDNFVRFSRRTHSQLNSWAKRYAAKDERYEQVKEMAKGVMDRYMAINLTNPHTVELRMWRGTLVPDTFFATLQLVDVVVKKAIDIGNSPERVQSITWEELVESDHPELLSYLAKRGLLADESRNVVEPVEEPEGPRPTIRPEQRYSEHTIDDFQVGDRVHFVYPGLGFGYDRLDFFYESDATIQSIDNGHIGCVMDTPHRELHNLHGNCVDGHGQWCWPQDLRLLSEIEAEEAAPAEPTPEPAFRVGDRVRVSWNESTGTIAGLSPSGNYAVALDLAYPGAHDCGGITPAGRGFYFTEALLTLI